MKLFWLEKLTRHASRGRIVFVLNIFDIKKINENKIVCLDFILNIDLSCREQNFNFWVGYFFYLFKKKNQ